MRVLTLVTALVLLHGTVTMGPTTPVCLAGTPCSKPAAHVTLTFTRAGQVVRVKTDRDGRYRVSLRAGVWSVRASAGMRIAPVRFTVPRRAIVRRDFAIDTGIR